MLRFAKLAVAFLFATMFYTGVANAQATRTWVSGVGDDVNPCSRTAPCKTFAGAISKTAPGGEINCLDPAGFGAVTLTKSITIDCTGTLGGILASSTTGVIINGAGVIVTLRGLEINGGPPNLPGVNGVRFLQGARLSIEDCTIYNFLGAAPNGFGVLVNNTSTTVQVDIRNTVIRNNGTAVSGGGIGIIPTGTGAAKVSLNNVQITGHFQGVNVNAAGTTAPAGVRMAVANSNISDNATGISVNAATVGALLTLTGSTIVNNSTAGLSASGSASATILVQGTTIQHNGSGLVRTGGAGILSYGDNLLNVNLITEGTFSGSAGKS
jgi:hypothetical protein